MFWRSKYQITNKNNDMLKLSSEAVFSSKYLTHIIMQVRLHRTHHFPCATPFHFNHFCYAMRLNCCKSFTTNTLHELNQSLFDRFLAFTQQHNVPYCTPYWTGCRPASVGLTWNFHGETGMPLTKHGLPNTKWYLTRLHKPFIMFSTFIKYYYVQLNVSYC